MLFLWRAKMATSLQKKKRTTILSLVIVPWKKSSERRSQNMAAEISLSPTVCEKETDFNSRLTMPMWGYIV